MSKNIVVGLLVRKNKSRERVLKIYSRYNTFGIKLISFTRNDINWKKNTIHGYLLENGSIIERTLSFPQVIINRCYISRKRTIRRLEKVIGKNKVFNTMNCLNKLNVYRVLEKTKIKKYLPHTSLFEEVQLRGIARRNTVFFLKPCIGNQGRGVYRIEYRDNKIRVSENSMPPNYIERLDNEQLLSKIKQLMKNKKYIVQQAIPMIQLDEQFFDLRVLIQKNGTGKWVVTNVISRFAHKEFYNTSITERVERAEKVIRSLFPARKSKRIMRELEGVSIEVASQLEKKVGLMGELSVDFGINNKGKLWIIEVNGNPGKSLYKSVFDIQERRIIYERPLEYALYLSQIRNEPLN